MAPAEAPEQLFRQATKRQSAGKAGGGVGDLSADSEARVGDADMLRNVGLVALRFGEELHPYEPSAAGVAQAAYSHLSALNP